MPLRAVFLCRSSGHSDRGAVVLAASARQRWKGDPARNRGTRFATRITPGILTWMRTQRGTSDPRWSPQNRPDRTLYNYGIPIRELIRCFGENPGNLDAQCLSRFVLQQSRTTGWAAAKRCTTALRVFLRFVIAEGRCPASRGRHFRSCPIGVLVLCRATAARRRRASHSFL
jgi:hypothetical protein